MPGNAELENSKWLLLGGYDYRTEGQLGSF